MNKNHHYIAIETERHNLTPLFDLDKGRQTKSLRLTTMVDRQRRAIITVFLYSADKRILLKQYDLKNLPPKKAGPPRFVIEGSFDGSYGLKLSLHVDGQRHSTDTISLKRHMKKRRILPLLLIFLFLAFGALAFLLLPRGCSGSIRDDRGTSLAKPLSEESKVTSKPEPRETPVEKKRETTSETPTEATSRTPEKSDEDRTSSIAADATVASEQGARGETEDQVIEKEEEETAAAEAKPPTEPRYAQVSKDVTLYFGPNDARLSREAEEQLRSFAKTIAPWEELTIRIEGHCALFGTEEGREDLSVARAEAGASFLKKLLDSGPQEGRIEIKIIGKAGKEPVTRDRDQQDLNRRIELSARGNVLRDE